MLTVMLVYTVYLHSVNIDLTNNKYLEHNSNMGWGGGGVGGGSALNIKLGTYSL